LITFNSFKCKQILYCIHWNLSNRSRERYKAIFCCISTATDFVGWLSFTYLELATIMLLTYSILLWIYGKAPITAVHFPDPIPDPILFQGNFALNNDLAEGTKYEGIPSQECVVEVDGSLYAGLKTGQIVKVSPVNGTFGGGGFSEVSSGIFTNISSTVQNVSSGRPLGIEYFDDALLVADAIFGIYSLNLTTGDRKVLVEIDRVNPPLKHPSDLTITADGKSLYFSDASTKFNVLNSIYINLEGTCDGRVFKFDMDSGKVSQVLTDLCYPNGLQFNNEESKLLVSETSVSRVQVFNTTTWLPIQETYFPTYLDNIKRTKEGDFLLAGNVIVSFDIVFARRQPLIRQWLASSRTKEQLQASVSKSFSAVYKIDENSNVLKAYYDPIGSLVHSLSHVSELSDGRLVLGSYDSDAIYFVNV